jgi:hypothetical protein
MHLRGRCGKPALMSTEITAVRGAPEVGPTRVPAPAVRAFIRDALVAVQIPPDDAARVAELMTEADLTGADAHGVFRLPQYVKRVEAGGLNRRPNITVDRTAAATALIDGDNGFGHLVMSRAAETAAAPRRCSAPTRLRSACRPATSRWCSTWRRPSSPTAR